MSNAPQLPGHPFVAYKGDVLHVEGVPLSSLAQAHGTPLFVYSKAAMLAALAAYQRGFAGRKAQICYAMKANSSLGVLQVFANAGSRVIRKGRRIAKGRTRRHACVRGRRAE